MLLRPLRSRQAASLSNKSLVDLPLTIKRRARPSVLRPTSPSFTASWVAASGLSVNNNSAFPKAHPSGRSSGALFTKNPVSGTFGGARRATDPFKLSDFKLIGMDVLPTMLAGSITIRFSSDNFATKRVEYSWPFPSQVYSDGWNRLTARVLADASGVDPNGGWTVTGGMMMDETINAVQISINSTANQAASVAVDSILLFEKTPAKGVVMFGFDRYEDASLPTLALPIALAQGIKPYAAGDTDKLAGQGANWARVKQLYDAGWPIISQGPDHKDYVIAGAAQLTTDVAASRAALTAAGFTNALEFFAYPLSSNNVATDTALYESGFKIASTGVGWNGHPNEFNAGYKLIGQGRQNIGGMTLTQVKRLIDRAAEYGVVVDLFCHGLAAGGDGTAPPADTLLWFENDWRNAIIYAKTVGVSLQNPVQFAAEYAIKTYTAPVRRMGLLSKSGDGSVGQTYTAPAGMVSPQWYREVLTGDRTKTLIEGATALMRATDSDDGPDVATPLVPKYRMVARGTIDGILTDAVALATVLPAPLLMDGFENLAGLTVVTGAVAQSTNVTDKVQGNGCLELTRIGQSFRLQKTLSAYNMADLGVVGLYASVDVPTVGGNAPPGIRFSQTASFSASNSLTIGNVTYNRGGWSFARLSSIGTMGTFDPALPLKIEINSTSSANNPNSNKVRIDALVAKAGAHLAWVPTWDDNYRTSYEAYNAWKQYGIVGTCYICVDKVGNPSFTSRDQYLEMKAGGWDLQANITPGDEPITDATNPTISAAHLVEKWNYVKAKMAEMGLNNNVEHGCWSNGTTNNVVTAYSTTFTSDGSNVIVVASAANLAVGQRAEAYGIPYGSHVTQVSGTSVTLDAAVPVSTGRSVLFQDDSHWAWNDRAIEALRANGLKTGRNTNGTGVGFNWRFGPGFTGPVMLGTSSTGKDSVSLLAEVDTAIAAQSSGLVHYFHAPLEAVYTGVAAGVYARQNSGLLTAMTISQMWARDGASYCPV